ncbi:MAG: hypothetical protein RBU25_03220 [Lentisphaeria bacterium]|jgi:hypothetical protein|nr:hypothetical protein [Lentisphaeria bacterium]
MISKEQLEELLRRPGTKCVLAFEEAWLPRLEDYCEWAVQCVADDFLCDALLPVASHCGEEPISYYRLMADLRFLLYRLGVAVPVGIEAAELFFLGLLEQVATASSADWETLLTVGDLAEDNPELPGGHDIANLKYQHRDPEGETCEDVLCRFHDKARELVEGYNIQFREEEGRWRIVLVRPIAEGRSGRF